MRRRRGRKKHELQAEHEPFHRVVCKSAMCLIATTWFVGHTILLFKSDTRLGTIKQQFPLITLRDDGNFEKIPSFQSFQLQAANNIHVDAYSISRILEEYYAKTNGYNTSESLSFLKQFHDAAHQLKADFSENYGGELLARFLIHSGVEIFHSSNNLSLRANTNDLLQKYDTINIPLHLKNTAGRILEAKRNNRPFRISFGGYSVTAGRGNYFNQSYPFVMERLLKKPMAYLGIKLLVRNAAIGGVPSFPYGWCLNNFLGDESDVISWDFSMNEAGGIADGLEAYIRHGMIMQYQPMLIVKDTSGHIAAARRKLLQRYVDIGALDDPIILSLEDSMDFIRRVKKDITPKGFREWEKFGAPKGSPGQTSHHPGVKEHELMGWLLSMHFLAALEFAAFVISFEGMNISHFKGRTFVNHSYLPSPSPNITVAVDLESLFYGYNTQNNDLMSWRMNPVYCRTTYDPIIGGSLQDIVVSGSIGTDLDVMLPKGAQMYNKGWVLDLGEKEKTAKRRLERYGGLGFIDSKKAFYGIYASGPLELFVPCIDREDIAQKFQKYPRDSLTLAKTCFVNFVVCEVNEKHTGTDCNIHTDLMFIVGGVMVTEAKAINVAGTQYWGRNICVSVGVPFNSTLSTREYDDGTHDVGMYVQILVKNPSINFHSGPCSVSHIVWEQMRIF